MTFGVFGEPATLNPFGVRASDLSFALVRPVYRSLYRFAPDGSVVADLAESEEGNEERVRVRLRTARWSDGRPITARDVVASVRRAARVGRLSGIRRVRPAGPRTVVVEGRSVNWQHSLAFGSVVLPRGRFNPHIASGPYTIVRHRPGLGIDYEPNAEWDGMPPSVEVIKLRYVASLEIMLALLERGRLDAAWPPSAVNLHDRLQERGLESGSGPFATESIYLDLPGASLSLAERRGLLAALDLHALERGFIRDLGNTAGGLGFLARGRSSLPEQELQLAAPAGDELLVLMQRAMQAQLDEKGIDVDILAVDPRTYYSDWVRDDPVDLALRRGFLTAGTLRAVPLFDVESVVTWRPGVEGIIPPATVDGPLWNVERWSLRPSG